MNFPYLVELQRRDIENPSSLSAEFPYMFKEKNTSAEDNIHLGMMNVFNLLDEQKEKGADMDGIDVPFLIEGLSEELENGDLLESYNDFFVDIEEREGLEELR